MDPIDELERASGLGSPSRAAAEAAWAAALATAREAWPHVRLDEAQLAGFFGPRLAGADLVAALARSRRWQTSRSPRRAAAQEPTAHAAFDACSTEVDAAGAATARPATWSSEVKQLLRVQLLVAQARQAARHRRLQGQGSAARLAADHRDARADPAQEEARPRGAVARSLEDALGGGGDPVLEQTQGASTAPSSRSRCAKRSPTLSAEDRTLLRQQIVDGLSIDAIGAAYGVHRATAARWLNRARGALVARRTRGSPRGCRSTRR